MSFVGTKTIESEDALKTLIEQISKQVPEASRCFFLRWPHKVSGLCRNLPADFPSPKGQVFTHDFELRWQTQGKGYSLLLLSQTDDVSGFEGFSELEPKTKWSTWDRPAHAYPATETRFPKGIADRQINIGQRYFQDRATATVHFVALVALS